MALVAILRPVEKTFSSLSSMSPLLKNLSLESFKIRYMKRAKLIGIAGPKQSGKDTVAKMIQSQSGYSWEIKKFAGKLKVILSLLTGIPVHLMEDEETKNSKLGMEWNIEGIGTMTVRQALQFIGTDLFRAYFHKDTWVNALFAEYTPGPKTGTMTTRQFVDGEWPELKEVYPDWIISDVRFPNEAKAIRERNGIIIKVERPGFTWSDEHPSENALTGYRFDYIIDNSGGYEDLKNEVRKFIKKYNLE